MTPDNQPHTFANPELNGRYTITGADHEVEIQDEKCPFKGRLSQLAEDGIKYLIARGHSIVAAKTGEVKPAPKDNPAKP